VDSYEPTYRTIAIEYADADMNVDRAAPVRMSLLLSKDAAVFPFRLLPTDGGFVASDRALPVEVPALAVPLQGDAVNEPLHQPLSVRFAGLKIGGIRQSL
jgi:hypothetical protein